MKKKREENNRRRCRDLTYTRPVGSMAAAAGE